MIVMVIGDGSDGSDDAGLCIDDYDGDDGHDWQWSWCWLDPNRCDGDNGHYVLS